MLTIPREPIFGRATQGAASHFRTSGRDGIRLPFGTRKQELLTQGATVVACCVPAQQ